MNFFKALFGGKEESPEEKRLAEELKNFDILKYDGVKALKTGQWEQAIRCLNHAISIKEDLECRDYLSQALLQNNELTASYEQLQKLQEAEPENQGILLRMAQVAFLMEDYGAMASSCEKALLISQDNPEIYYLYGRACLGQEDLTNALAMYTKAISINENYADAYLMRANVLLEKGEVEDADKDSELAKALSFYNKVIEQNPFSIDGYSERAKLKVQMDDQQGAAEDLAKLKDINPDTMNENLEEKMNEAYKNANPYGF